MNTYIQNKLDVKYNSILQVLQSHCGIENSPEEKYNVIEKIVDMIIEKTLTDYHNHIVEKIKNSRTVGEQYGVGYCQSNARHQVLMDLEIDLLQDTNPKE